MAVPIQKESGEKYLNYSISGVLEVLLCVKWGLV